MKITCDSCGSKYTIADAKVKGRKVKVRCKGCKESILVDGTQLDEAAAAGSGVDAPAAAAPEPAPEPTAAPKDTWSVNLSDDDSREMTIDELVQAWKAGVVTSDAYVWKDGMGDWKPILEVGELKLKLGAPAAGAGIVTSAAGAAPPVGGAMDDLFGGVDLAGSGAGTEEPPTAQPPGAAAAKPTGARNDSSVLFSLDNLNAGAGAPKRDASEDIFGNLGMGAGTLNTNADLLTAPAKDPPPAPAGARMPAPAPTSSGGSKMGPIIGGVLGVAVLIGGAFFFMGGSDDEEAQQEDPAVVAAAEEAKKKAEEERKKAEEERKKMAAELEAMQKELKEKEEAKEEKKEAEKEEKKEEEKEEEKAAATDSGSSSSSSSSSSTSSSASSAPPPFNIGAAKSALVSAAANAAGCKKPGGPTGSGKVQVTFSTSGRVTSAQVVSGPFGGTAVGGCVASTFRRARVPAFSGGSKTVAKSFRIP